MNGAKLAKELQKIESKYGRLNKIDPNASVLHKLQDKLYKDTDGFIIPPRHQQLESNKTKSWAKRQEQLYQQKVIALAQNGYTITEIKQITHSGYDRISRILRVNKVAIGKRFNYQCQGVYVQTLANLTYFGINGDNYNRLKCPTNNQTIKLKKKLFRWEDVPNGAKYMIKGDNSHLYLKRTK